jgi:hypothetical protein
LGHPQQQQHTVQSSSADTSGPAQLDELALNDSREGCGTCSSHHKMHVIPACKSACGCVVVPAVTAAAAQPAGACANAVLACEACNHAQHNLCVLCEPQEPPWQQLDSLQAASRVLAVTWYHTAAEVQSRATAQQSWKGAQAL